MQTHTQVRVLLVALFISSHNSVIHIYFKSESWLRMKKNMLLNWMQRVNTSPTEAYMNPPEL